MKLLPKPLNQFTAPLAAQGWSRRKCNPPCELGRLLNGCATAGSYKSRGLRAQFSHSTPVRKAKGRATWALCPPARGSSRFSYSDLELSEVIFNGATCLAIRAPDHFFFVN